MNVTETPKVGNSRETILHLYSHPNEDALITSSCRKNFIRFFSEVSQAFPDYKVDIDSMVARGNRVIVFYTISGTHEGEFRGLPATNRPMAIRSLDEFRVENDVIVEYWEAGRQLNGS